jgi:hypothetical protein
VSVAPLSQVSLGPMEWGRRLVLPGADYSVDMQAVQDPHLLDSYGVDGRFIGAIRTFPGMRALGINAGNGPRVVGPGISGDKFWKFQLPRNKTLPNFLNNPYRIVKFFKSVEFRKSRTSSDVVSGFLIGMPYYGPKLILGDATTYGLPYYTDYASGVTDVLALLYFNRWITTAEWQVRILNCCRTTTTTMTESRVVNFSNVDASAYGDAAYLVGPESSGYGAGEGAFWGTPYCNTTISGADFISGPAVLYWDETAGYPKLRTMGGQTTLVNAPQCVQGKPSYAPCTVEADRFYVDTANGRLRAVGMDMALNVAVSFYNSVTGTRSRLYFDTLLAVEDSATYWSFVWGVLQLHQDVWTYYDQIELWRSALGVPGILYLENVISLGALPVYNATIDCTTAVNTRNFAVCFGLDDAAEFATDYPNMRYTLAAAGQFDNALMQLATYDGVWEFADAPPTTAGRVLTDRQATFMVDGMADDPGVGFVPTRLRWTSLALPRPENFSDRNNLWYPDEDVGMVFDVAKVSDLVFIIGTRGLVAVQRAGDRLNVSSVGKDLCPVNRFCWAVSGDALWILTRSGLKRVSGYDGAVEEVPALNRELLSIGRWGRWLSQMNSALVPPIGMAYDGAGQCLIIWNVMLQEALVYWTTTGLTTKLADWCWGRGTQAQAVYSRMFYRAENNQQIAVEQGQQHRAFFMGEAAAALGPTGYTSYLDIFTPNFGHDSLIWKELGYNDPCATMHGDAGWSDWTTSTAFVSFAYWPVYGNRVIEKFLTGTLTTMSLGETTASLTFAISAAGTYGHLDAADGARMAQRFSNAYIHLFAEAQSYTGVTHHYRRVLYDVSVSTADLLVHLKVFPGFSAAQKTLIELWHATAGSRYVVAPIPVRIVPGLLPGGRPGPGKRISVNGGELDMDPVLARLDYVQGTYGMVNSDDLTGMPLFAVGYAQQWTALTAAPALTGEYLQDLVAGITLDSDLHPFRTNHQISDTWFRGLPFFQTPCRFYEMKRAKITPSRNSRTAAFALPFAASEATVGIEAYPSGVVIDFRGLRVTGQAMPASK